MYPDENCATGAQYDPTAAKLRAAEAAASYRGGLGPNPNRHNEVAPPRQPYSSEIQMRLADLAQILDMTGSSLVNLRSRYFGSWPEEASRDADRRVAPGDISNTTLFILDELIRKARTNAEHANVLDGSL